jgi:hypothetical protein
MSTNTRQTLKERFATTPGVLKAALVTILVATALTFGATLISVVSHRTALTVIGKEAVPNIVNAQRIRAGR